jgi:hypothetical protein
MAAEHEPRGMRKREDEAQMVQPIDYQSARIVRAAPELGQDRLRQHMRDKLAELVCQGKMNVPLEVLPYRVLGREPDAVREQRLEESRLDARMVSMRAAMERAYRRNSKAEPAVEDGDEWWRESSGWR